jgi:TRAP-type uncharacterized transport system fused permease subunit
MAQKQAAPQLGVAEARRLEEEELGLRHPEDLTRFLVPAVALCWSLFQLSVTSWLLIDSTILRSIHLSFAFLLVFFSYPAFHHTFSTPGLRWLSTRDRVPFADILLGVSSATSALYIIIDYEGIASRVGAPNSLDMVMGFTLFLMLLEATRRAIGPALPIIALLFTFYAFFGPYMPDVIAFKGVSLNRRCFSKHCFPVCAVRFTF